MLLNSHHRAPCGLRTSARRLGGYFTVLAALLITVLAPNAFAAPTACNILYTIQPQNTSAFGAAITIQNTGTTAITSWSLTWAFANGQTISSLWNGAETQSGANVTVNNESYNGSIAAGASLSGIGFNGTWNGATNAVPTAFSLSGTACSVNGSGSGGGSGSFSLKPSASSLSLAQGASGTDTVTVSDVSPFNGSVTLAASGLPSGVTASFGTNPATGSSALTLAASSTAAAGTSTVTITGTSGSLGASTTIALTVTSSGGGGTPPKDGIPLPSAGVALQGVTAGPITILNWAGFKAATSWTFDDSQPSQIQHFADIQAVGVPVTYYITSGTEPDSPNYNSTWIQAVSDGDELGNHTEDHCQSNLTDCITNTDTGNLATEIDNATSYIEQNLSQKTVWTGASPYGDTGYDSDASSRFFIYRGIEAGSMLPNDGTNQFNVPCHLASTGETAAQFNAVTDAARSAGAWQIFLIHTITPTANIWYNPVAVTDVTGAMTHAKTAGDTWVDSVVDVGAYWIGLKVLASATRTASGNTTTWKWTLPAHFPGGKYLRVTALGGSTLSQNGTPITENSAGFFSVSLDAGSLTLTQ